MNRIPRYVATQASPANAGRAATPKALRRKIDRLSRAAHRFHRFAHHPLCERYAGEVIRHRPESACAAAARSRSRRRDRRVRSGSRPARSHVTGIARRVRSRSSPRSTAAAASQARDPARAGRRCSHSRSCGCSHGLARSGSSLLSRRRRVAGLARALRPARRRSLSVYDVPRTRAPRRARGSRRSCRASARFSASPRAMLAHQAMQPQRRRRCRSGAAGDAAATGMRIERSALPRQPILEIARVEPDDPADLEHRQRITRAARHVSAPTLRPAQGSRDSLPGLDKIRHAHSSVASHCAELVPG